MAKRILELGKRLGSGSGYDYGNGDGSGAGSGYGSGSGNGAGSGAGYGYGYDYGDGSGAGYGYDYGDGSGDGYGSGSGYGDGSERILFWQGIKEKLDAKWVLAERNAEIKRELIEAMGYDRFFSQLDGKVIHQDKDGYNNPRSLIRIPMEEAEAGYLQAVKVICPSTDRIYFLGVPANVKTCQEAVASTFGIKPEEYYPRRES